MTGSPLAAALEGALGSRRATVAGGTGRGEGEAAERSLEEVHERALAAAAALAGGAPSLEGRRVAMLVAPGLAWVEAFLGIVLGGGIAVPLSPQYPTPELAWFIADAEADVVVASDDLRERAEAARGAARLLRAADLAEAGRGMPRVDGGALEAGATCLLLYTSGTTGKPKGARITHANLATHTALLREAWGFGPHDVLLHALPLHHLHGLCIALLTALCAGGSVRLLPHFDARRVWDELGRGCTAWMAVPTMYQKLFEAFDAAGADERARWAAGARALRLATSGSAALPVTLAERWREATGAIPLERFGMTEIGVGTSNPLDSAGRRAGTVGRPLPTVETRLVDDTGAEVERGPGELWVRGPSVIPGYWRRPEATEAAFTDGWFRTGDVAERSDDGYVRLLGRTSVDILKSGGYKLSALEIEEALRENGAVAEVAVVGVPDATWGDRVVAVVVPCAGRERECAEDALRAWAKERIAPYKVPREVVVVDALPRNAVGKVVKPELVRLLLARRA